MAQMARLLSNDDNDDNKCYTIVTLPRAFGGIKWNRLTT